MIIDKVIISSTQPNNSNVVWAKPVDGGFSLYLHNNGKWQLCKIMEGNDTDTPEDDIVKAVATVGDVSTCLSDSKTYTVQQIAMLNADLRDATSTKELNLIVGEGADIVPKGRLLWHPNAEALILQDVDESLTYGFYTTFNNLGTANVFVRQPISFLSPSDVINGNSAIGGIITSAISSLSPKGNIPEGYIGTAIINSVVMNVGNKPFICNFEWNEGFKGFLPCSDATYLNPGDCVGLEYPPFCEVQSPTLGAICNSEKLVVKAPKSGFITNEYVDAKIASISGSGMGVIDNSFLRSPDAFTSNLTTGYNAGEVAVLSTQSPVDVSSFINGAYLKIGNTGTVISLNKFYTGSGFTLSGAIDTANYKILATISLYNNNDSWEVASFNFMCYYYTDGVLVPMDSTSAMSSIQGFFYTYPT